MGNISWTKNWSSSDNGTILYGQDLQNIQSDITAVVNGNITNANVNASAAIVESKISFNTTTGHTHNGTDSRALAAMKHYRKGLLLKAGTTADDHIKITPGIIDVGGETLITVADSSNIDVNDATNWINGAASASIWCYVYVYSNSAVAAFKLSNEAPDLSFDDDTTAEIPFRYQKYSTTYYRCIGAVFIDAAGDLCWGQASSEGLYVSQFDHSNTCIVGGLGTGSDQTIVTLWTPKYVKVVYGDTDATPVAGERLDVFETTPQMLDANWYGGWVGGAALNVIHDGDNDEWVAITTPGSVNAITAQTTSVPGSFTVDAMTDNYYWYAIAYTDEV